MQQYTGIEITNPKQGNYTLQMILHGGFFLAQFYAYLQYQKGEMAIPYKVSLWIIVWGGLYGLWVAFITLSSIQGQPADIVVNNVALIAGHVYLVMMMLKARRAMENEKVG